MNPITTQFGYMAGTVQTYNVTVTGTYTITAVGAGGGSGANGANAGGLGAEVGGTFNLTAGQTLNIIVGGQGSSSNVAGGGGGFSEIYTGSGNNISYLVVAGGGGGGADANAQGASGQNARLIVANDGGSRGAAGNSLNGIGGPASGAGGAGATADGQAGSNGAAGGGRYAANGGTGGIGNLGSGGFGGGGAGGQSGGAGGGGGGGYSGGTGGNATYINANNVFFPGTGGLGGTSFLASSSTQPVTVAGFNALNGNVTISFAAAPTTPTPAPCYVTGTRIRVLRGLTIQDVPVETLRVGDLALTASGRPRPIRWIGTRNYPGLSAPKHDKPVRIRAGALHDGVPARNLLVSPDHALFVDGLFVAAGHLVNGTSISRGEVVADLTYLHVELDSHDLLLAENTPAESFLAAPGVRAGFDGPVADDAAVAAVPYAPRTECGADLDALRKRLALRAGLSVEPTRFGTVRAWMDRCDGTHVAGWARDAAHPDGPMCLDIVVDGTVVAMTLAEVYRPDIAAAGVGDGHHGFDVDLDEPLAPGLPHTVEVRRSADGLRICAMEVDAAGAWTPLLAA